jgi:ketosteroid isomerase-like protein
MKMTSATAVTPGRQSAPSGLLARALNSGNLDRAAACFARDACLITPDATAVHGRERIRPVLAQMVACQMQIRVESSAWLDGGEVVLARERWTVRSGERSDSGFDQTLDSLLALRRIEGAWKLVIAAPWGWGKHSAF